MTDAAYKANYLKIDWRPLPPVDKPIQQRGARSGFPCPMVTVSYTHLTLPPIYSV